MSREHTSRLLRQAYDEGNADAAIALLDQSMALGHRRIALIRYLHAQHLHAPLAERHHAYVQQIAARMSPATLARVAGEARTRAMRGHDACDVSDDRTCDESGVACSDESDCAQNAPPI